MDNRTFIHDREEERRVQDLAHQLLDACREIVAKHADDAMKEPEAREMASIDLAVQTLFMCDHLGQDLAKDGNSPMLRARRLGISSGLGQVLGSHTETISMALNLGVSLRMVEKAAFHRHSDSRKRFDQLKKEGKL